MSDTNMPRRLYHVQLFNVELQREHMDMFSAENIRISPSGVLECDRVFNDTTETLKIFYHGDFHICEFDKEDVEEFEHPHECEHDHGDDEE